MALRILWMLAIFCLTSVMALVAGRFPGMLSIHPSGEASYVSRSHCIISTEVKPEEFVRLTEWCVALQNPKK